VYAKPESLESRMVLVPAKRRNAPPVASPRTIVAPVLAS